MVNIRPFRGLRYNPKKICDLSDVITAPYDRIHEAEQARYYELSPYNFVRIIQGYQHPDDTEANNVYTRARCYKETWLAEGVFIREPRPALYVIEQHFTTPDGKSHRRLGLTVALELSRFDEGIILPHEYTLRGPKEDRLKLTQTTETAWGHIFLLYSDRDRTIHNLLRPFLDSHMPALVQDRVIEPDVEQNFWVVNDPDLLQAIVEAMAQIAPLIIADGHHRYETALVYRDQQRTAHPDAPPQAAFNYVLATLVSMDDPGLVVLPTHRLIHSYHGMDGEELRQALATYFEIQKMPSLEATQQAIAAAHPDRPRYGFFDGRFYLLTLKDLGVMDQLLPDRDPSFRRLDVTILHTLALEHILNLSKESISRKENLTYLRDPRPGIQAVTEGKANFLFLLNPTRIDQVRACTEAGERMPQKSTDFYPKVVSGLVALPLRGRLA